MRGQTTIDFAVGALIFLGVVGFVFLFVSSAVTPFTGSAEDDTVVANRIADELSSDVLGSPADPYVLDPHCTQAFFATLHGDSASLAECTYENTSLTTRVGVTDRQNVNVTLLGNTSGPPTAGDEARPLCWDEANRTLVERADTSSRCGSGYVSLTAGENPEGEDSTITARRTVSLAGRDVFLVVEVW